MIGWSSVNPSLARNSGCVVEQPSAAGAIKRLISLTKPFCMKLQLITAPPPSIIVLTFNRSFAFWHTNSSSIKEALLLETFSTKVLHTANHHFIPHSKSYFENLRIEYTDILQLTDYGIISALADSSLTLDVECNYSILCQNNQKYLSIKSTTDTSTTLYLPIYLLSKFGAELISIINQGSSNEALNYFAMEIKTTNPDIETDVRNLVEISIEPINN